MTAQSYHRAVAHYGRTTSLADGDSEYAASSFKFKLFVTLHVTIRVTSFAALGIPGLYVHPLPAALTGGSAQSFITAFLLLNLTVPAVSNLDISDLSSQTMARYLPPLLINAYVPSTASA